MELWPQHSWHPVMVHLPLVTLPLAVLLDAVAARSGADHWRDAATMAWWLGLLGAGAAVGTGLAAYYRVEHSDLAHLRMTLHRNLAFAVLGLLVAAAIWRWRRPLSPGSTVLGIVGAVGLAGVGYLGGELVYRHAVGLPTEVIEEVIRLRGGHAHGLSGEAPPSPGLDSMTVRGHAHPAAEGNSGTPVPAHDDKH